MRAGKPSARGSRGILDLSLNLGIAMPIALPNNGDSVIMNPLDLYNQGRGLQSLRGSKSERQVPGEWRVTLAAAHHCTLDIFGGI